MDSDSADDDFKSWADNLGMDTDSRRAYATWQACRRTARDMGRLFTASELSDLAELFQDY